MEETCEHKYVGNPNIWERPYCEKCGKEMPYSEIED